MEIADFITYSFHLTVVTDPACPLSLRTGLPVATSQTITDLSIPQETTWLLSHDAQASSTSLAWPP